MSDETAQATSPEDLREQILSPSVAKNEREWWASHEIERLQGELDKTTKIADLHRLDAQQKFAMFKKSAEKIKATRKQLDEAAINESHDHDMSITDEPDNIKLCECPLCKALADYQKEEA